MNIPIGIYPAVIYSLRLYTGNSVKSKGFGKMTMENLNEWTKVEVETEHKRLFCHDCQEKTSHVSVDTIDGTRFSCEVCGAIGDIEDAEFN